MTKHDLSTPEDLIVAGVRASYLEYLHGCPVCFASELAHYCRVPSLFRPGEFIRYERCSACSTVFRNPRLPSDYRESRYEKVPVPESALTLKPENQLHYRYMVRLLRRLMQNEVVDRSRLLDFGCGSGGFLVEAREAGFEVMGLELNKSLAAHVETELGIMTFQGLISAPEFAAQRFEVIISSQVFEHLVDPRGTLLKVRKHLVPPGFLLIEVPNIRHVRERLRRGAVMDDSHLFYFSAASLTRMLNDAGFRIVKVEEGLRPYRVLARYSRWLPDWLHSAGQQVLSILQIKTGLSVIARLEV